MCCRAVYIDCALLANILDNIPVNGGLMGATGFWVSSTEGNVDRAARLFIHENIFTEVGDVRVDTQGKLADLAGAGIALDNGLEKILMGTGCRFY